MALIIPYGKLQPDAVYVEQWFCGSQLFNQIIQTKWPLAQWELTSSNKQPSVLMSPVDKLPLYLSIYLSNPLSFRLLCQM